jgi:hypothetical protein
MSGSLKGSVVLAKQNTPGNVFAQHFLYTEAIISKSVVPDFQNILNERIKMANYIMSRPLYSRLFSALYSAMEAADTQLVLHTEVR